MEYLQPCPYCESKDIEVKKALREMMPIVNEYWVECNSCTCKLGPSSLTRQEMIDARNAPEAPDKPESLIMRLKKYLTLLLYETKIII